MPLVRAALRNPYFFSVMACRRGDLVYAVVSRLPEERLLPLKKGVSDVATGRRSDEDGVRP